MDLSKLKHNDYLWWGVACLTGAILWSCPFLLHADGKDRGTSFLIATLALLLSGIVFGYFKPQRPWRWALASVLPLPIIELITFAAVPKEAMGSFSLVQILPYLLVKVPIYALQGLPVLIGAYLAGYAKKRATRDESSIVPKGSNRIGCLGFSLGLLASGIPLLVSKQEMPLIPWVIGLFLCSVGLAVLKPERVWRWAIAVGFGLPAAVIIRIIIDLTQDSSEHNLFPIEIFISLVIAAPCTFAGAYVGLLSKSLYSRTGKKRVSGGT
jgi:hypothetical protein